MKKILKLLQTLFLTALLLTAAAAVASCDSAGEQEQEQDPADTGELLTIAGNGMTEYTIIRSEDANEKEIAQMLRVKNAIKDATGVDMNISTDFVKRGDPIPEGTKEILIGATNRPESENAINQLKAGEFFVGVENERLIITGYNNKSIEKAVDYFINTVLGYNAGDGTYETNLLALKPDMREVQTYQVNYTVYMIENSLYLDSGFTEGDITRFYSCMQGLYNRDMLSTRKVIYLNYDESDGFWFDYITAADKFMYDSDEINLTDIEQLWEIFMPFIKEHGIITWDPKVPATANVANTICGLDGYLPVRYDESESSLYSYLVSQGVEVKQSLTGLFTGEGKIPDTDIDSTGSTKCDAYLWAMEKYMDRCDPGYIAYVLDGYPFVMDESSRARDNMVYSIDYMVMKKMFFVDLFYSTDEVPNDDPDQRKGTDRRTLGKIFSKVSDNNNGNIIQLIGFPFWWIKYSNYCDPNCRWAPSESEWAFAEFASGYNITMEADAAGQQYMTNASVYTYYPLAESYPNNHTAQEMTFDENTRYFTIYMGDYDSSAWMKYHLMTIWQDVRRGSLPLMWGFNPNLAERCPMVWDWIMTTMTPNDYILTGDSGAGYLFPSQLSNSSADIWVEYCKEKMGQFDMDMVAFLIDGYELMNSRVINMYKELAPNGIFYNSDTHPLKKIFRNGDFIAMPCQTGVGLAHTPENFEAIMKVFTDMNFNFAAFRTVLERPSTIEAFVNVFTKYGNSADDGYNYVYVDPYTMMNLIRQTDQTTPMG